MSKTWETKQRIADVALALFKTNGYEAVSVREICDAAGVARSSFYNLFSKKSDIILFVLESIRYTFPSRIPNFIDAESDLERIWFLMKAILDDVLSFGPELVKVIIQLEMTEHCGFFQYGSAFNDWMIRLLANCQKNGIARNQQDPSLLVPILVRAASADLLIWVCKDGNYPILEILHSQIGTILDVVPEYRHQLCDVITENRV